MFAIIQLLATFIADLFKSPRRLEVENLFLRYQLNVAMRRAPQRVRLRAGDRALMIWMTRAWPSLLGLSRVVQPDTILRWHRAGFRAYWRWKSRGRPARPRVSRELASAPLTSPAIWTLVSFILADVPKEIRENSPCDQRHGSDFEREPDCKLPAKYLVNQRAEISGQNQHSNP
jgi:hypothetical protein